MKNRLWRTRPRFGVVVLAAALTAAPMGSQAKLAVRAHPSVASAARWLAESQQESGAFGSDSQPVDQLAETLSALLVARAGDRAVKPALGKIAQEGPARAEQQAAYASRIAQALILAGENPRDFDGFDYIAAIKNRYNQILAAYGGNLFAEALAALGLLAAGETLPAEFIDRLIAEQCPNGGYVHSGSCGGTESVDTTTMVVSVLHLAGVERQHVAIDDAINWLSRVQHSSGGFPEQDQKSSPPNANSTGLVVSMMQTLDVSARSWRYDPHAALVGFTTQQGGLAFTEGGPPNLWATVQGIPALAGSGFPFSVADIETAGGKRKASSDPPATPDEQLPSKAITPAELTKSQKPSRATQPTHPTPARAALAVQPTPENQTSTQSQLAWIAALLAAVSGAVQILNRRRGLG
jgi:hypothetical protein